MKAFEEYQHLDGEEMTERDKKEAGSKFWNEGKWNNFVLPFIPDDCTDMTLVDMGCNAGLFLKLAEEKGFRRVVGVDSNEGAVNKGIAWRDKHGYKYQILNRQMENCIDELPAADYTVLANTHYYMTINDWLAYLDKLQYKTRFTVIVTAEKHHINRCWAMADVHSILQYFATWKNGGFVDALPTEGDPSPRKLWGLCFQSPHVERVPIDSVFSRNQRQDGFYGELDAGKDFHQTGYYRYICRYRKDWPLTRIWDWFKARVKVYNDLKSNGLKTPILVGSDNVIVEGNHRYAMLKNLQYKNILIRRTA